MELLLLVCLCLLSCSGDGALPKPSVKILDVKGDKMLLHCEVQGTFPKPTVVWQNQAGETFPSMKIEFTEQDGSYSIILETTVPKNGLYSCVARLEGTSCIFVVEVALVVGLMLLISKYIKRRNGGSTRESTVTV